jgi:hypothetical protein
MGVEFYWQLDERCTGDSYGQEALLSLPQTLPEVDSLESWLRPVLDVDLETIEAECGA